MEEIIEPGAILTADARGVEVTCRRGAAVLVDGGVIVDVDDAPSLERRHPSATVKRRGNSLLMPGFVNGHHHIGVTPVQLGTRDSPLETWVSLRSVPVPVDLALDTTYSASQMIRSGVTSVQHLQEPQPTDAADPSESARTVLDTYGRIGMRASFGKLVRDQNYLVHGQDSDLIRDIPSSDHSRFRDLLATLRVPVSDQLQAFTDLRAAYADHPRLSLQLAPANLHWVSDEALEDFGVVSDATGAAVHMHLLESVYQSKYMDRRAGADRVRHLTKSGLLTKRLTLGHGTWMQPADIEALAEADASVCNNCSSNFRLASGRLPLIDLLAADVNVAIGIDEAGINDDHDMLQEMRLIFAVNREPGLTNRQVSAEQVFRMATSGGARSSGYGDGHGTITPGAPADLLLLDENELRSPFQLEGIPEVELVVQRARPQHITDVMVAGEWLMADSELTTIDESAMVEELAAACAAVDLESHRASKAFAENLTHAVRKWFVSEYGV
ncbi:amidohydrolase family protein [Streptomyces sp. NPDC001663]|uniref:amidohydrolase family protein n=1 Tax=Streptomyces sp. NPDC001663 TaxID=3364597 RepID=UPI0036B192A5